MIFSRQLAVFTSKNSLNFLSEIFENSTIFQHFNTFINSIETILHFQDNLDFKGKIKTKFPHKKKKNMFRPRKAKIL